MDARVAASLDHWLTTPPEPPVQPLPGDEEYPRCKCGKFLKLEPERVDHESVTYTCPGFEPGVSEYDAECGNNQAHAVKHRFVAYAWDVAHRTCSGCGHDNTEVLG